MAQRGYQLEAIPSNFDTTFLTAWIEDLVTGTVNPIYTSANTRYDFSITTGYNPNRYRIVFKQANPIVLPVILTSLKASMENKNILVDWEVQEQVNISSYEVEKSADGINFNTLIRIAANGTNGFSTSYTWLDKNVLTGMNYYRI